MSHNDAWDKLRIAPSSDDLLWEIFHENSKTNRYDQMLPDDVVVAEMQARYESLPFSTYPLVELPQTSAPLSLSMDQAITARCTARELKPCDLSLEQLGTILYYAYGVTRDNRGTHFPRPFRTIPSGGGLFPLEIFFYSDHVAELVPGLYHFNAAERNLRLLRPGALAADIAGALVQPTIAHNAAVIFFVTALFDRTIFKYKDRGYRFIFLEAGHLMQNLNLTAVALGLGVVNIGGFFDRDVDRLLGIDGVTHSTIYMCAIGHQLA